jgi:hypothetical protein
VSDGWGDLDGNVNDGVGRRNAEAGRGLDMDVRQIDDGQLPERDGMLRVCDGGDEVCSRFSLILSRE